MTRLNFKKGDKCIIARIWNQRSICVGKTPLDNLERWTWEAEVITVSEKYTTVDFNGTQMKFVNEFDYIERVARGEGSYKLYTSRDELLNIIETDRLYDEVRKEFSSYHNSKFTLEQLKQMLSIINK